METKETIIAQCNVPASIAGDRHVTVDPTTYRKALTKATKELMLSLQELRDIRDGKASDTEIISLLHIGNAYKALD